MELLKKLTGTPAPSGNEQALRDVIINEVKDFADEISTDTLGNLIVRKKGEGKKLMLSAHMDEAGIISTVVDDNGFVYFSETGDVKPNALHNCKVVFLNGRTGIIAEKAEKPAKASDYFVDTLQCKGEKLNSISVGDMAVFASAFDVYGDFICTKALNSRAGCYVLMQALKSIAKTNNDLYFVFTVQHHLGLRGAKTAAAKIQPDYSITIDYAVCDDLPGGKNTLNLGAGPVIKVMDGSVISHPKVKKLLFDAACAQNIQIQYQVAENKKSDAGAIQTVGVGVLSGVLSVPIRYINTPCETASFSDIKNTIKIISKIAVEEV